MSFIGKRRNDSPLDSSFVRATTDFHSHVLPLIDDGSGSVEESLEMLSVSYEAGIKRIVATPHFYARYQNPERFFEKRAESAALLTQAISEGRDRGEKYPELLLGAEVAYFDGISRCEDIKRFCVEGTQIVLIEMPFQRWNDKIIDEMHEIKSGLDMIPVVAHVDRYYKFQSSKMIDKLLNDEILVQANADGFINRRLQKRVLNLLDADGIDFLGSDCHNMTLRKPNLDRASEIICSKGREVSLEKINEFCDYVFSGGEAQSE